MLSITSFPLQPQEAVQAVTMLEGARIVGVGTDGVTGLLFVIVDSAKPSPQDRFFRLVTNQKPADDLTPDNAIYLGSIAALPPLGIVHVFEFTKVQG